MTAKMHRMNLPKIGEGVIYIPSGMPLEADDVPQYPAGSYMRLGNKEFVYAIAGDTLNPDMGAMNSYKQKVVRAGCTAEIAAGETVVGLTIDTDPSPAFDEGVTKDELKGGQFIAFPGSENSFLRGIVGNTLLALGGGTLYVTLDSPTPVIIPITKWCECIRNPYGAVKASQGDFAMVMGMPTVVATDGQGLWLQVGGPSWAAPVMTVGAAAKDVEVVFVGNGSIALRGTGTDVDCQHAGVCIALASGEQGSMMIMLQIAH